MPHPIAVPSLYNACLKVIEDDFIIFVRDEMCLQVDGGQLSCSYSPEIFSECVTALQALMSCNVPLVMRKDLLERVLGKGDLSCAIRYAAIEILYASDLKNFTTGSFPQSFHPMILSRLISDCAFLKYLDLTYFWVRGTDKRYLSQLFSLATNLTSIVMPQICDDSLLNVIGQSCHKLSLLDIQDSGAVTEEGISSLIFSSAFDMHSLIPAPTLNKICGSLVVLKLGGPQSTSLAPSCIAILLKSMPFLTNLGPYTYCGHVMQYMLEKYTDSKCTSLFYIHDVYTNSAQIDSILKMAPRLRGAFLDTPHDIALPLISKLKVEKLKIRKVLWLELFRSVHMMQNLQTLELLDIRGQIDLSQVSQLKSLKKISIYQCHPVVSTSWSYFFQKLTFFEIYHTEISDQLILHLLTHCPAIKHFGFGNFGDIGDEELIPILSTEKLITLEELWIARAQFLTEHSLATLLDCCPGLKSVGKLGTWDTTEERIQMFQKMIELNNWDLKLWGFFRES